jgi:hypothetical protein
MTQLFLQPGPDGEGRLFLLRERAYALDPRSDCPVPVPVERVCREPQGTVLLRSSDSGGGELWIAVCGEGSELRINGLPPATGVRVLRHRDELRLGKAEPLYLSTERTATIEPYAADDEPTCPRCRSPILRGQPSVRCPNCDIWYHEDHRGERPCWQYGPECLMCRAPTELDAGFRWTPEGF